MFIKAQFKFKGYGVKIKKVKKEACFEKKNIKWK